MLCDKHRWKSVCVRGECRSLDPFTQHLCLWETEWSAGLLLGQHWLSLIPTEALMVLFWHIAYMAGNQVMGETVIVIFLLWALFLTVCVCLSLHSIVDMACVWIKRWRQGQCMVSGDHGGPTVCVPGPAAVEHGAHLETATDLSKYTHLDWVSALFTSVVG